MGILGPSIARLMLAVLTAAIGFMTLRTQSEFWFGVLVATAFAWGLLALDAIVADAKERDRPFWGTFLLVALATLIWGFGPLSDRSIRGNRPGLGRAIDEYYLKLSHTSIGFCRIWRLVEPHPRTEAIVYDDDGRVHARIVIAYDPEGAIAYDQYAFSLADNLRRDSTFFSSYRPDYPTHFLVTPLSPRIYLDACYLLLALLMGFITAAIASASYAFWYQRQSSAIFPLQRNQIAESRGGPRMITLNEQAGP